MSTLTAKQVQTDVIALLRGTSLAKAVNGEIYRAGYRPRDSRKEDIVVVFTEGTSGQTETGTVTLNIFVPDVMMDADGTLVEDGARTAELEAAAQEWFDSLAPAGSDYLFSLRQTICTEAEPDTDEHFVTVRLGYRHFSD